jgi:hypothetical protein
LGFVRFPEIATAGPPKGTAVGRIGHTCLPRCRSGFRRARHGSEANRRLNHLAESVIVNVGGRSGDAKASSPPTPSVGVGAAVVVRGRESRPHGEGRQSVGKVAANVTGCQHGGTVAMNVGEMQRLLSGKAEREPGHRFGDLFGLLCDEDASLVIRRRPRWTGRGKAGCGESRMSGLARGVGRRADDGSPRCEANAT